MEAPPTTQPYTITDAGKCALLTMADGRVQLFVAHDDAEREGQRLTKRAMEQPMMWVRTGAPGTYPIPKGAQPTHCASCGFSIVWARTAAGKAIPLSLATARTICGQRVASSHFADCPDAKEWSEA